MVSLQKTRKEKDVMKLLMSKYEVDIADENNHNDLYVIFHGPKNSLYEGGIWRIHVVLPENYPYKSPSIGFVNRIYHPNVDESSGSICLDVINQTWSPMFDLINIFDVFLPQLLLYPNPADPLNGDAGRLMKKDPERYNKKVQEYIKKYASENISMNNLGENESKNDKKENNETNNNEDFQSEASSELSKPSDVDEDDDI